MAIDDIQRILTAKADAVVRRATAELAALRHPDFTYVNASGKTFDKAGYLDTYCKRRPRTLVEGLAVAR